MPDGTSLTNEYFLTGELKKTYGSRTYPVEYTYDPQGRMKTMKTWQNFAGNSGTATTTWNYDVYRGFLSNKRYPDSTGPDYTYTAAGRLQKRTWARGSPRVECTYSYHNAGVLSTSSYNDGITAGLTNTYDRRGRMISVAQGAMTTALTYNDIGQLSGESYSGGTLGGLLVTNMFDSLLRRTNVAAKTSGGAQLAGNGFSYDNASRLQTVSEGNHSATYAYLSTHLWWARSRLLRAVQLGLRPAKTTTISIA